MSRQTEKLLVIDTETCNTLEQPIPYDIGYAVCDRKGNVCIKRSFIVAEVFLDLALTDVTFHRLGAEDIFNVVISFALG